MKPVKVTMQCKVQIFLYWIDLFMEYTRMSLLPKEGEKTILMRISAFEVLHMTELHCTERNCSDISRLFSHSLLSWHPKLFIALLKHGLSTGERTTAIERGEEGGQPLETLFIDEEWKHACSRIMSFWAQLWPRGTELSPSPITNETSVISSSTLDSV